MNPTDNMGVEELAQSWLKWKSRQPSTADTSMEAFAASQQPKKGALQHVSDFIGTASQALSRFDPRVLVAGDPNQMVRNLQEPGRVPALEDPLDYYFNKERPITQPSVAGAGRAVGAFLDEPGSTRYADVGQHSAESAPRVAGAAAAGLPVLISDMVLQGYSGAKDQGASGPQAVGAGLVGGAVGAAMPAFARAGSGIAAEGLARFAPAVTNPLTQRAGEAAGANLAMLIPQMVQKPATEVVMGQEISQPLSTENLLETAVSNVALAPLSAQEVVTPRRTVASDGRVIEFPSFTALERSKLVAERASKREGAMERLYAQFMLDAPESAVEPLPEMVGPPTLGQATARIREKAYETMATLDDNERAAMRPLEGMLRELSHTDTLQQEAHAAFVKAAGLDVPSAKRPEFSLTTYAGEDLGDPKTLTPIGILDRIIAGELLPTGGLTARKVGVQGAINTEVDTQHVDLLRRVFGPRALAGEDFVDMSRVSELASLASRVMNAPRAGESAETLPVHLQGEAEPGREKLSTNDTAAWEKLDNTTKDAAVLAAKILQDPYSVLGKNVVTGGLDPARWTTTEPNYLRVVHDLSASLYKRWDRPITDVETAGALVRDVNFFIDNIRDFLDESGFGDAARDQLQESGLRPLSVESINEQFNKAVEQYLNSPNAEAAAQTLQWVKNRILLAAQQAKTVFERGVGGLEPGRIARNRETKERELETEFMSGIEDVFGPGALPAQFKGLLEGLYKIHRAERTDKKGETSWKLDDFRRSVARSVSKLSPEQRAKLDTLPDLFAGLDAYYLELYHTLERKEVPAALRRDATERIEGLHTTTEQSTTRAKGGAEFRQTRTTGKNRPKEERAEDDDTAAVTSGEKAAAQAKLIDTETARLQAAYEETVAAFEQRREAIRPVLEKIPAVRVDVKAEKAKGDSEEVVESETVSERGSNLYKVVFEPIPSRVMDARRGGMSALMSLDQSTGEGTTTVGDAMSGNVHEAFSEAEAMRGSDEAGAAEMQGGETPATERVSTRVEDPVRENALVEKYFTGTPRDPHEVINEVVKPNRYGVRELENIVETIFPGTTWKTLRAKAAAALGVTANEAGASGKAHEWLADFLRADIDGPGSQLRTDWMQKNPAAVGKAKDWAQVKERMLTQDSTRHLQLKARLLGLEQKPGVDLGELARETKAAAKAPRERKVAPKFEYDVQTAFNRHFLKAGYQPELAKSLSDTLSKMTKNFTWLDNAEFAMLTTDKRATANQFLKDLKVLGVHIPTDSMVGGKRVSNPIVALAFDEFINKKEYAAFNGFLKISTLAHEAFHAFKANVVDNPNVYKLNEDSQAQVAAYRQMEKLSADLPVEDRVRVATALIESMIPTRFVRGTDGQFLPEVKGIINGATRSPEEFMAFYYQIVATGLAAKVAADPTSRRGMNDVRDAMQWLSRDEQNFLRGQFRHVGDMLDALQLTLDNPDYRRSQGYVKRETEERQVARTPEIGEEGRMVVRGKSAEMGVSPPYETRPAIEGPIKKVPFEYAVPQTKDVGLTARSLASAAETIAMGGYGKEKRRAEERNALEQRILGLRQDWDNLPPIRERSERANQYAERLQAQIAEAEARLDELKTQLSTGDDAPIGSAVSGGFGEPGSIQKKVNALKLRQAELRGQIKGAKGDGDIIYPAQQRRVVELVQELAKVDKRVERAEALLKDMETFADPGTVADRIVKGEIQKIDVSDIEGNKEFFIALFSGPPKGPPTPPAKSQGWAFEGDQPAFTKNVVGRFLAKFQPWQFRTYDLYKRGLPVAEKIRQTLDRIQPEAHKINHAIMDPIVARFGNFDSVRLDTTKDFFRFLSDDGKTSDPVARKALNEILLAQQSMKGLDVLDPQMQKVLQKALSTVPPPKRAMVVTAVRTINEIYANRAAQQLGMAAESQMNAIASLSMKMVPGQTVQQALTNAKEAVRVSESGVLTDHQAYVQGLVGQKFSPAQADALLRIAATGHTNVLEMQKVIRSNGNFASEQRVGEFVVSYTDANGDRKAVGALDKAESERIKRELEKQKATNFHRLSKAEMAIDAAAANSYEGAAALDAMIRENFKKQLEILQAVDPNLAEQFQREFNPSTTFAEYKAVSSAQKNMLKRELKGGREDVDYVETMFDNISRTSISLARRSARERFELLNTELAQMGNRELAAEFQKQLGEVMTPESPVVQKIKTTVTGWLVPTGANAMLEMGQMLGSGNTMLFREGLSTKQIAGVWKESLQSLAKWKFSKSKEFHSLAEDGQRIETARYTGQPLLENRDSTVAFYLRRMNDEARLGHEALMDLDGEDLLNTNLARASRQNNFNWYRPDQVAGNLMYQASKNMLRWYSVFPRFNNWAAANTALRVGYDKGLRGNELYTYATSLKDTMTIAGGRANKPSVFAVPGTGPAATIGRSAVAMASMLSNYALGSTTLMAMNIKDATMGAPGLNPKQRIAAGKAATNALLVQLSLAGALGLPMAGALTYLVEQLTGSDTEKAMREFARLGQDDELGEMYSDMAMNGWVNRASGMDLASKAGVNSFFGINGYNGFDPVSMFGPAGTVVKDMWSAAELAVDGNGWEALAKFVPRGLRGVAENVASRAEYGDLRVMDNNKNLLHMPSAAQALGMALGFQPAKVKEAKQKARLVHGSEQRFAKKDGNERDQLALGLLSGDAQSLAEVIGSRMGDTGFDAKSYVRNIVERAADMQVEKDPTNTGSRGNMKARGEINSLMPGAQGQEQQRLQLKAQLFAQLGNPMGLQTTQKDLLRAMVVDELRAQDTRMTRQEALVIAEKMLGN